MASPENINGKVFPLIPETKWEKMLSVGGFHMVMGLMKQVPSRGHNNGSVSNDSASHSTTNSSNDGSNNAATSSRIASSGHTLVKDHDYGYLCEQLRPCIEKWPDIANNLGFKGYEIATIRADPMKLMNAPGSYMDAIIDRWSHWAPGDARGSKDYATLEALRSALDRAGFPDIALRLTLE